MSLFRKYDGLELTRQQTALGSVDGPGVLGDLEDHRERSATASRVGNSIELDAVRTTIRASSRSEKDGWRTTIPTSRKSCGPTRRRGTSTCRGRTSTRPEAPTHGWCVSATSIRRTSDILAEPRGSRRLDGQPKFDFKAEKRFRLATGSLGVSFEAFNLFNNGAVNDRSPGPATSFEPAEGWSHRDSCGWERPSASSRNRCSHRSPLLFREAGFFLDPTLHVATDWNPLDSKRSDRDRVD